MEPVQAQTQPQKQEILSEPEKKTASKIATEPVYSAGQLAEHYTVFNTSKAVVIAALRIANKPFATLSEAKRIVNIFRNQEV